MSNSLVLSLTTTCGQSDRRAEPYPAFLVLHLVSLAFFPAECGMAARFRWVPLAQGRAESSRPESRKCNCLARHVGLATAWHRCLQRVIERLPAELSPADAAAVAAAGAPHSVEGVPGVVLVPGSGPHLDIDWSLAGGSPYVMMSHDVSRFIPLKACRALCWTLGRDSTRTSTGP